MTHYSIPILKDHRAILKKLPDEEQRRILHIIFRKTLMACNQQNGNGEKLFSSRGAKIELSREERRQLKRFLWDHSKDSFVLRWMRECVLYFDNRRIELK